MLSDKLVQEFKDLFKKEYGQELTDAEARDQGERLVGLFDILFKQAQIEFRRKLRLKKEKIKGFYLDPTEGPYTCAICGENYPGNDIWWNTKGLRCRDCWNNIKAGVIPPLKHRYDKDNIYFQDWQIQDDFGVHPATRGKLKRDGLVKESGEGEEKEYALTVKGEQKLEILKSKDGFPDTYYTKEKSNKIIIVMFDIPEKDVRKRTWLRMVLNNLDFKMAQKSVWIGKTTIPKELIGDLMRMQLESYVEIFEVGNTGNLKNIL